MRQGFWSNLLKDDGKAKKVARILYYLLHYNDKVAPVLNSYFILAINTEAWVNLTVRLWQVI
jgi:hypothetical protein